MKKILLIIVLAVVIAGFGGWWVVGKNYSNSGKTSTSADNAPPGSIHNLPVPEAVSRVRSLVAKELGISEGVVIVMSAYEKNWPDGCLGLGGDKMCTQAIVPGYEVTVQAKGTERTYRTSADGSFIQREKQIVFRKIL
ncbi:MAG: hypothetical protein Q7K40_03275 [bacterium]|nr:hypothetical protein [bacterium]